MLRHRLTVPPSYCRDVVVAGNIIQTVQTGLRQSYECLASAPIACTARQMVFSSPWLTAKKESGSPLQTALVCNSNPLIAKIRLVCFTTRVVVITKYNKPQSEYYWVKALINQLKLLQRLETTAVLLVSFDAVVASTLPAACLDAAATFYSA
ncbi:hypothetical protein Tco_0831074 [Tanacetum coccineum]